MIVQYQYVIWSPPQLTEAQELELGRQIALVGRDHFVREFRKSIGKTKVGRKKTGIAAWPSGARWAFIVVFGGLMLFGALQMTGREWGQLFARMIVLSVFVLAIWFVSVYLAAQKFERWIDHLVAKYAAHVARGEK